MIHAERFGMWNQSEYGAGTHAVSWDGRDASGARVAAGTYFVKLAAGDVTQTRKVVYLGEQ